MDFFNSRKTEVINNEKTARKFSEVDISVLSILADC